jgi:hypothetical protein
METIHNATTGINQNTSFQPFSQVHHYLSIYFVEDLIAPMIKTHSQFVLWVRCSDLSVQLAVLLI